ncbi:type VI secretion system baseplate subunit TssK [Pseudomonas gingeri]|uniref:type VI secretion system baseplate subunit TssK n=1 Tax=Pseudomonas gingeri TaxID=117681 RepID=UPI002737D719|nr:type VI secretion system baseplate subunit TssK [Pseudomonas gingeri]
MRAIPDVIPDAICWSEGMQLLPQHFQLQNLRAEGLSARLAANARPWYWGVQNLEQQISDSGEITLKALDAVMPDGLVVNLDPVKDKDCYPLQLKLKPEDFGDQTTLMIYLAVDPLWRAGVLGISGRLRSLNVDALDLSDSKNPRSETVSAWRPILNLVTSNQRSDYVCLPLFRISYSSSVFSQLDYVPPCPVLESDSLLGKRIGAVCATARDKCEFLSGRWRQAQESGKLPESIELRAQLVAIWSRLPELQAMLETDIASPADLYLQLNGFAGALYGLQPGSVVPAFGPLKFDDLLAGFDPLLGWIETQLGNIRASYTRRSFEHKGKYFAINLKDQQTSIQELVIGLRMPAGASPQAAADWLENAFRASQPQLPALVKQRSQGLAYSALGRTEQAAYVVAEDIRLFKLQASGGCFDPQAYLCLYMPPGSEWRDPIEILMFDATRD